MRKHIRKHHGHVSSLAVVYCEDCESWFTGQQQLEEHKENHSDDGDKGVLHCKKCSYKIKSNPKNNLKSTFQLLQGHMEAHHQGYVCTQHGIVFDDIIKFKAHMINENQAPVNCDICLKVLKGPEQLKIHIGTVHEEKTLCLSLIHI